MLYVKGTRNTNRKFMALLIRNKPHERNKALITYTNVKSSHKHHMEGLGLYSSISITG